MQIIFSIISIIVILVVYKFITRQITRMKEQKKLDENFAFILRRILRWGFVIIVLAIVVTQFGLRIDLILGLWMLAGGTVIGFAAINTLGNAIAGFILMISRPFGIGDRIFLNGQFADVEAIDLIYTRMRTMDNVIISVPNQELIRSEIDNFGKDRIVRRRCSITAGYELDPEHVEKALLIAAEKVEGILEAPPPYVWITNFDDFAVEYTLYVFINDIKHIQALDARLRKIVLETCKQHDIEIATPTLIRPLP